MDIGTIGPKLYIRKYASGMAKAKTSRSDKRPGLKKANSAKPPQPPQPPAAPTATAQASIVKQLLIDCAMEARVAVQWVSRECSRAGAKDAFDRSHWALLQRRETLKPNSQQHAKVQRQINESGARGVQWQPDKTPMTLLEALATQWLTGPFDVNSAKIEDLWKVIAVFVVVEQKDLTPYALPDFMMPSGGFDSAGDSRESVCVRLKHQHRELITQRVLECTRRLESRSPTQRIQDELAALKDPVARLYRGLEWLCKSSEANDSDIRKVVLDELMPLVRDVSLNWPAGANASSATRARDQAASALLPALADCLDGVTPSAIEAMRQMQRVLHSALLGIVEMPVNIPVRSARDAAASVTSSPAEQCWRNTKWIIAALTSEDDAAPVSLASRLREFARRNPRPSCVKQAKPNAPYLFEVNALCDVPEFSDIKRVLEPALKSGFLLTRQRKPTVARKRPVKRE